MHVQGMVGMIPVTLQPEPNDFQSRVRKPGLAWLRKNNVPLNGPVPSTIKIPSYWSRSNKELWEAYDGVCAYLAIYFEWVTGAASTDHFVAKSVNAGLAYEWTNYRLSCLGPNRNKNKFDDVLDPVGLTAETFLLNLVSGEIYPNPALEEPTKTDAGSTIKRLKLNSPDHNLMRQRHYKLYLQHKDSDALKRLSPFVWYEAQRQGLL